ncbi:MAG TPA: HYR domain-containing protein, partial [Saprospiraceae bacterium]|nr:HYR domain-containing protein [Saprospiraceae bacterium]
FLLSTFLLIASLSPVISQQTIDLHFTPETTTATVGSMVSISLDATTLEDLLAMQVDIIWDSTILELQLPLTDINPLFASSIQTNLINSGLLATQWVEPTNTQSLSGTMYVLQFMVLAEGSTQIQVNNSGTSPFFVTDQGQATISFNEATVTGVPDTGDLTLSCNADINTNTPVGADSVMVTWNAPTATTTCPNGTNTLVIQTAGPVSGSYLHPGQYTITYTATDDCGNTATCSFDVNVTQGVNTGFITLNCPKDDSLVTPVGQTSVQVDWSPPTPTTTCSISSDVSVTQTAGLPAGSMFEIGSHIVTYTATDSCGNTETCSFSIIVVEGIDIGALTLNCPQDISVTLPAGQTSMSVSWATPTPTTTCSVSSSVTLSQTTGPTSGSSFNAGNYIVTYSATDDCDNDASCSFNISVTESTTGSCPDVIAGFTKLGEHQGHGYYLSTAQMTWQNAQTMADDQSGYLASITSQEENNFLQNEVSEMAFIGINDEQTEGSLIWDSGESLSYTNYANCSWCGENTAANDYGVFLPWDGSWSFDNIWVQRKMIMEKVCGSSTTSQITFNCPANISLTLPANQSTMPVSWDMPTASTTCMNTDMTMTQTAGSASGSDFAAGTYTISYQATDECGSTANCSFTITITDESTPTECPPTLAGFTKLGDLNGHGYYLSESSMTWMQAQDVAGVSNGYIASITSQAENEFLQSHLNEMAFIGLSDYQNESDLTWESGEALGYTNYSSCSWCGTNTDANDFGVFLPWDGSWSFDNQWVNRKFVLEMNCGAPNNGYLSVFCPDDVYLTLPQGQTQMTYSWDAPIPFTTCPAGSQVTLSQTAGPTSGSSFTAGTYTISYEATDACDNTATCSFTITVTGGTSSGCGEIAGFTLMTEANGHGYYISNSMNTWNAANSNCQAHGGYLAAINDQAENDMIKNLLNNNMVFIGYNDADTEGSGTWSNGQPVTIDLSYNNSADADYAVMNFWAGTWEMYNQWVSKKYVMEKSCSDAQPSDIQPSTKSPSAYHAEISPNPATDFIYLNVESASAKKLKVSILTPSGKQIMTSIKSLQKGNNRLNFSIAHLNNGLYFVQIIGESTNKMLKFVKQ